MTDSWLLFIIVVSQCYVLVVITCKYKDRACIFYSQVTTRIQSVGLFIILDGAISFQAVLCHEMGHSFALDHTNDSTAVMYAELLKQKSEVILKPDDIEGIQALYGPPNNQVSSCCLQS